MANTRNPQRVGGGLGTFRAQGAQRFEVSFLEQAETARRVRHTRACQAMHRATRDSITTPAA